MDATLNEVSIASVAMTSDQFQKFCEAANSNPDLLEQIKEAGADSDKVIAIAKEAGCEICAEDLELQDGQELTAEELEAVAGGAVFKAFVGVYTTPGPTPTNIRNCIF